MNHRLIHHFLEQSAERYPDKVALIHGDTRATYAEINAGANQLALYLIGSGVQPGDRVIICTYASLDEQELKGFKPNLVYLDENNHIKQMKHAIPVQVA